MNLTWASAAPTEEPVKIGSINYVLREASAGAASEHKDATFRAVKVNNSTNVATFGGIADADLVLLSRCLFEDRPLAGQVTSGAVTTQRIPVSIQAIREWANRVTEPLVEHLKKISSMQQTETAESLRKQQEVITAKLVKLEGTKEQTEDDEEPCPKNSPSGATPN